MVADLSSLPNDVDALKAALIAARSEAAAIGAELAQARATATNDRSLIAYLKLEIERLRRAIYGPRSERTACRAMKTARPARAYSTTSLLAARWRHAP